MTTAPPPSPPGAPGPIGGPGPSPARGASIRLTQYAAGGGCACKLPAGQLESLLGDLRGIDHPDLIVGLDDGDDACAVRLEAGSGGSGGSAGGVAILSTADFFTPMVDDAYTWGRIAAANALSDVYAMGGRPIAAINLVGWPVTTLPDELLTEVLRGGLDGAREAGCPLAGGHSITAPEPLYGMAVTGVADPDRLLRNDAAAPGLPLSLTKPLGVGLLNNRHKATGERFEQAVASMTALNAADSAAALAAGVRACTDVTGFGLLGHLLKMMRASGTAAVLDLDSVPVLDGAREAYRDGFVPGGSLRNLDWVRPHLSTDGAVTEEDLVVLADAQTSGGLLVVGELPGRPVVGQVVAARPGDPLITVRG